MAKLQSWWETEEGGAAIAAVKASERRRGATVHVDVRVKVAVVGAAASGKTRCLGHLCGHPLLATGANSYSPTVGLQLQRTHWPFKREGAKEPLTVELTFWEAGAASLERFEYLHPALLRGAHVVMHCVSLCSRRSFHVTQEQLASPEHKTPAVVIFTQVEDLQQREVSIREALALVEERRVVYSTLTPGIQNPSPTLAGPTALLEAPPTDVCRALDALCESALVVMKHVAAYLLAQLGGNEAPSAEDITAILGSVGIEPDMEKLDALLGNLKGRDIMEVIATGRTKMAAMPVGGGGGGGAVAAGGGGGGGGGGSGGGGAGAAAAEESKEDKKEEEEEEEEEETGFDLFD